MTQFPITPYLKEICSTLHSSPCRAIVLTAETGAGKSTILPLGLLENFEGKILMTEPRRLAVLGVANRVASLLDEECGGQVGYRIHLESKIGKNTRLEVLTEAILIKMLQDDPLLENYNVVVLDEFHERSVNTDLALAFLKEAMELRDDLFVVIMSATIDGEKVSRYLGNAECGIQNAELEGDADDDEGSKKIGKKGTVLQNDAAVNGGAVYQDGTAVNGETVYPNETVFQNETAVNGRGKSQLDVTYVNGGAPIVKIPGRTFPVSVEYDEKSKIEDVVLRLAYSKKESGNVLVFLPGIKEIKRVYEAVAVELGDDEDFEICMLHSSISFDEQKKVLTPVREGCRRIILSSAIAETSLTVPGVTCVVDSGLSRVNKMNVATGMENLVTEMESEFSAAQRCGRAGREQPGKCIRLWNEKEMLVKESLPEILRADLTELVLECAERGIFGAEKIAWIDKPGDGSWAASCELLKNLGCIKADGHITQKGSAVLKMGLHPRLACIALEGNLNDLGTVLLILKYSQYAQSSQAIQKKFVEDLKRRKGNSEFGKRNAELVGETNDEEGSEKIGKMGTDLRSVTALSNSPLLLLAGFPDRLAMRLSEQNSEHSEYQFATGRKATLHKSIKIAPKWIVAPEVMAGDSEGIIFEFEEITEAEVNSWLEGRLETKVECGFVDGKVQKVENTCYGRLVISGRRLVAEAEDYKLAWAGEIRRKGLECLPLDEKCSRFLLRVKFYRQQVGAGFGDESEAGVYGGAVGDRSGTSVFGGTLGDASMTDVNGSGFGDKSEAGDKSSSPTTLETYLKNTVDQWLLPFMTGEKLNSQVIYDALYWFLDGATVDKEVPEIMILPNGAKAKVKYEQQDVIKPTVEIIIQRIFGCMETPKVMGMKVLLKLLSPASRPLQITEDLEHFWTGAWPEICKEMKGRYPKHNWDYRIVEVEK